MGLLMTTKHEGIELSRNAAEHIATARLEEAWDGLMERLNDLRARGVPLDTIVWRTQVIEEIVPGQPFRSKRPGAKLTLTLTFFNPLNPHARKACGIKDPAPTETDDG